MSEKETLYIWENEVSLIDDTKVVFVNGSEKEFTIKELKALLTKEPADLTKQRELIVDAIVPDMLQILEDYNVKKWDIQAILNAVVWSYNETFNEAIGKAFWTYEANKHSAYFPENIRVSDIKKFIS